MTNKHGNDKPISRLDNETLSIVAMRVSNEDRSPTAIHG
jgi:hypothetical protein